MADLRQIFILNAQWIYNNCNQTEAKHVNKNWTVLPKNWAESFFYYFAPISFVHKLRMSIYNDQFKIKNIEQMLNQSFNVGQSVDFAPSQSSTSRSAVLRYFEVFIIDGSFFEVLEVNVIVRNFWYSARDSIFVVVIVLLSALEHPSFIRSISVYLFLSFIHSPWADQKVSFEYSTAMTAITAETAIFSGRKIEISFTWMTSQLPLLTTCLQGTSWFLYTVPQYLSYLPLYL